MSGRPLVVALAGLLLAGCSSGSVPTGNPTSAADQAACSALIADLPAKVNGFGVTTRSDYAVGWGAPRTWLACGAALPAAYQQTSTLVVVEGVSWLPEQDSAGYTFTAVGRTPLVQVRVPKDYAPEVDALVDLAPDVKAHTEVTGPAAKDY